MRSFAPLTSILPLLTLVGCGLFDRTDILVIARAGDLISIGVAQAWAEARDIPEDRILRLRLTTDPAAQRIDEATYLAEFAAPIEDFLAIHDPDREIRILVTTPGLPLQIGQCDIHAAYYPRDCESAAVDAALAQLGRTGDPARAFKRGPNPYFRDPRSFEDFSREEPETGLRFLVGRLPFPPPDSADGEFAWGVPAEEARGVETEARWQILPGLIPGESRSIATSVLFETLEPQLSPFGHIVLDGPNEPANSGDATAANSAARPIGIVAIAAFGADPGQGSSGNHDPSKSGPRLAYPGIVIELGGAIDGSKRPTATIDGINTRLIHWFARGARAISTHLGDPTLAGVSRPTAQLVALARGRNTLEAHFASTPQMGWRNVFVGDPLIELPEAILDASTAEIDDHDLDHDGVPDANDNCQRDANPKQRDSDEDGYGNRCDPDVDNDGIVSTSWGAIYPIDERGDLEAITLTAQNGPYDPLHDLNGDGRVDESDLIIAQLWLFGRPGP